VELSERYAKYSKLELSRPADGVLQIVLQGHGRANALGSGNPSRNGRNMERDVDADPATRVAVVRGPGDAFAAGGDINMVEVFGKDWEKKMAGGWKEARDIVYNIINCSKPVVLRDQGWCGGAPGSPSHCWRTSRLPRESAKDSGCAYQAGHRCRRSRRRHLAPAVRDGQGEILPAAVRGAVRRGSRKDRPSFRCVSTTTRFYDTALQVAIRLAAGAQSAIRWSKYALNNWLRTAGPIFDASLALESLGFFLAQRSVEGIAAFREEKGLRCFHRSRPCS